VEKEVEYIFRGERKGGDTMKYEKPEWEIILFETDNVIRTSTVQPGTGDGDKVEEF
jgi:hypothetical protein